MPNERQRPQPLIEDREGYALWESLSDAERRDLVVQSLHMSEWFDSPYIEALAIYAHDPLEWGRIEAHYKGIGGNTYNLQKAARAIAGPDPRGRTGAPSVALPPYAGEEGYTAAALLVADPTLEPALNRGLQLADPTHLLMDLKVITACVAADWPFGPTHALLQRLYADSGAVCRGEEDFREFYVNEKNAHERASGTTSRRRKILGHLSALWKIPLARIAQYGTGDDARWHLVLHDGREIRLGNADDLQSQAKVRARIFATTHKMIPRIPTSRLQEWDALLEMLGEAAELVHTPELSREGHVLELLRGYLEAQNCILDRDASAEEWEVLAHRRAPFVRGDKLYLSALDFWMGYTRMADPQLSQADIIDTLPSLGGWRMQISVNKFKTSRSVWVFSAPSETLRDTNSPEQDINQAEGGVWPEMERSE